jgi:hypothetical protein
MSNLLEQAIIDAAALREVAMKNAESALIEKYSKEFKESVEKLLEQEAATPEATDAATMIDPAAQPSMADASLSTPTAPEESEKAFKDVPSSFLEGEESEIITIDFDELKKQIEKSVTGGMSPLLSTPSAAPEEEPAETSEEQPEQMMGSNSEEEIEEEDDRGADSDYVGALREDEDLEEELELEEEQEEALEENIEFSESELEELAEELKVDINVENLSDGHMGTTASEKRQQRTLEMAAARDSKAVEDRKEEEAAMSDLKQKLEESFEYIQALENELTETQSENTSLIEKLDEMQQNLVSLKENVEKLSVSNAKLLYTNKTLGDASLNERQKQQIVENIAKAKSVLEAKTIYSTLQSTVSGVGSTKPKESLSEAIIRGNSPFLTRKQQTADVPFADRMKKLAGITS